MQVGGKLEGEEQLRANLSQLKTAVQKRVLRKAVRAGTLPLRKAFREAVPKVSGTAKKAVSVKIATSKKGRVSGVVGPKLSAERGSGATKGKHKKAEGAVKVAGDTKAGGKGYGPARYIWIAEKKRKRGPFIKPVFDAVMPQVIRIGREKLAEEIQAEIAKLKK